MKSYVFKFRPKFDPIICLKSLRKSSKLDYGDYADSYDVYADVDVYDADAGCDDNADADADADTDAWAANFMFCLIL